MNQKFFLNKENIFLWSIVNNYRDLIYHNSKMKKKATWDKNTKNRLAESSRILSFFLFIYVILT